MWADNFEEYHQHHQFGLTGTSGVLKPERRYGRFEVDNMVLEQLMTSPSLRRALMQDMVVLEATNHYAKNATEIVAWHPAFDLHEVGLVIPTYVATVKCYHNVKWNGHSVYRVRWSRV